MSRFVLCGFVVGVLWLPACHAQETCSAGTTATQLVQERHYDLEGKTYVITGGDSGVGQGIVDGLAVAGARIFMLAHNLQKTDEQIQDLIKKTGNTKVIAVPVNLVSMASVKAAVEEVLKQTDRVDGVINDAGVDSPFQPSVTADGFESAIQVEAISSYYLVDLLLPKLREVKGRVVFTSSNGIDLDKGLCQTSNAEPGCYTIESLKTLARQPNQVGFGSIFIGLYLKTMYARILAEREASNGVTAYSFHPGLVVTPGTKANKLFNSMGGVSSMGAMCPAVVWWGCMCADADGHTSKDCPLTGAEGAVSGAYLAAAPVAELAPINGHLTVACGVRPKPDPQMYGYLDPYDQLIAKLGQAGTDAYLRSLDELSMSWIASNSASALSQAPISRPACSIAAVAFATTCVLLLVAFRRQKPDMGNYRLLASENDAA